MYFRKSRYFLQKLLFFSNICKAIGQYLSPYDLTVLEVVVHIGSLFLCSSLMNFFTFRQSTDYILSVGITHYGETISNRLVVLPSGGIVVERSPIRSFAADYQFLVEALRI